jgi:hypothetical protein
MPDTPVTSGLQAGILGGVSVMRQLCVGLCGVAVMFYRQRQSIVVNAVNDSCGIGHSLPPRFCAVVADDLESFQDSIFRRLARPGQLLQVRQYFSRCFHFTFSVALAQPCASPNPAVPLSLQSLLIVGRVGELGR